jgi:glycosyltransferase involved in cell wall biosynthesis
LHIPPEAFVVGFVGRILNIKGIEELVRAWEVLSPTEPRLHLLFVGESDPRAPISARAESVMHSASRIHLAGFIEEPAHAYLAMDVVALPSYHEGLGYSLLEAAAMELPVIGTRIPGIVDAVLDGTSGILVNPGDPDELAAAILRYMHDPSLAEAHGKAGREFVVSKFQRSDVWDRILHLYSQLVSERKLSGRFLTDRSPMGTVPSDLRQ